ncbi:MAG: hypothetical protein Q8R25_01080 [bacterium]|nr:hypothetical protein [bacterium]
MIVRPATPRAGLAIRNAFQIATLALLGNKQYTLTHEELVGELFFDFSDPEKLRVSRAMGDSMRISNAAGKSARVSLAPLLDEREYAEFEIRVDGIEVEFGFPYPRTREAEFEKELTELAKSMHQRFALWQKASVAT